ncbi:uncharacterized protein LOC143302318 [Babylonia areolata]|uniref:uncharacterized protein LOC143302318 n=1 Tax=Babylonia areolata TaxID=304850 RepID=UPI003FD4BAED
MDDSLLSKALAMGILWAVTMAFGGLALCLHRRHVLTSSESRVRGLLMDALHCVAGGVFLGVCLLHLLPEGREDFKEYKKKVGLHTDFPLYEAAVGVGLFLITLVEKLGFALISFFRQGAPANHDTARVEEEEAVAEAEAEDEDRGAARGASSPYDPRVSSASSFQTIPPYPPVRETTPPRPTTGCKFYYGSMSPPADRPPPFPGVVREHRQEASTSETAPLLVTTTAQVERSQDSGGSSPPSRAPPAPKPGGGTAGVLSVAAVCHPPPPPPPPVHVSMVQCRLTSSLHVPPPTVTLAPRSYQSLNGSVDISRSRSRSSAASSSSPSSRRSLAVVVGAGEGVEVLDGEGGGGEEENGEKGVEREDPQNQHHHHHHHHSLAASTSCRAQDISEMSVVRALLLLLALSFHTVFDGLAVGLQESSAQVWGIMVGIAVHKALVAFCLGLDLASTTSTTSTSSTSSTSSTTTTSSSSSSRRRRRTSTTSATTSSPSSPSPSPPSLRRPVLLMLVFSLMAPLGVGVGMGVTGGGVDEEAELGVTSSLQALATGTFLYVTFFEVLGQQFAHSHAAGSTLALDLVKVFCGVGGFGAMAGVKLLG